MTRWLCFLALLAIAGAGLWFGLRSESGYDHAWLSLALVAAFAASDPRFWSLTRSPR